MHMIYELVEWTRACAFEFILNCNKIKCQLGCPVKPDQEFRYKLAIYFVYILNIFHLILNKWIFLCCSLYAPLSEAHILKPCVSNGYMSSEQPECIVILEMMLIMRKGCGRWIYWWALKYTRQDKTNWCYTATWSLMAMYGNKKSKRRRTEIHD